MVLINLNNQDMQLKYDLNAVCELEAKANKGLFALLAEDNFGFNLLRLLTWSGLRHKNRGLTLDIVGIWLGAELVKGATFDLIFEKIMQALRESGLLGKEDEEQNETDEQGETNPVT
jgi:hypothetical protein